MKFIIVTAMPSPGDIKDDPRRFERNTENLHHSLTRYLEVPGDAITLMPFSPDFAGKVGDFHKKLTQAIIDIRDENLCLIYIGHGQRNGWALSGKRNEDSLSYRNLRLSLVHHSGNLIFLNSACYGGMGAYAIDVHSGEHLLISPMAPTRSGYATHFFGNLIVSWGKGELYRPENFHRENPGSEPLVYGNENLQRFLFLKDETRPPRGAHVL